MARPKTYCTYDGCSSEHRAKGYCTNHYYQFVRRGKVVPTKKRKLIPLGGTRIASTGYVLVKTETGYRQQHTVVMEEALGRSLTTDENVHHMNGDKTDNRPENLELWSTKQPPGQRVADKLEYAREILRKYSPDELRS